MQTTKIRAYRVDGDYTSFLRKFDKCVPHSEDIKEKRPFIGIVLNINDYNYYAPLTSPKPKHLKMHNQMDFIKINEGKWGAINLNNMIPIPDDKLIQENYTINKNDLPSDIKYKTLVQNQIQWCNDNKEKLYKNANKLYHQITENKAYSSLASRCCNFKKLESVLDKHLHNQLVIDDSIDYDSELLDLTETNNKHR